MFIWACGPGENFPHEEMLLGQVNLKMMDLIKANDGCHYLYNEFKICLSNLEVGRTAVKIRYKAV